MLKYSSSPVTSHNREYGKCEESEPPNEARCGVTSLKMTDGIYTAYTEARTGPPLAHTSIVQTQHPHIVSTIQTHTRTHNSHLITKRDSLREVKGITVTYGRSFVFTSSEQRWLRWWDLLFQKKPKQQLLYSVLNI